MSVEPVFISGCYIVKDEEELLGASLEAVRPFVDEIVVYDTGSSDDTVAVARAHGARVVEGYWDDHFGDARNRALEHCRGGWVLAVDADEVAQGNPGAWRRSLRDTAADCCVVEITSRPWGDAGRVRRAMVPRVLRRGWTRWEGGLHERIVPLRPGPGLVANPHLQLRHYGYTASRIVERDKHRRNVEIAERELAQALASGGPGPVELWLNVGRSACAAGQHERALEAFSTVRQLGPVPALGILAAHSAVRSALARDDVALASSWLVSMRAWGEGPEVCRAVEGRIALAAGDLERAESLLRRVQDGTDYQGLRFEAASSRDHLVECLVRQGRVEDAAAILVPHVASGASNKHPRDVLTLLGQVPGAVRQLVEQLPADLETPFVGQLKDCAAETTSTFYEEMWRGQRAPVLVLAAVSRQWSSLPFEEALVWSLRLRERGLAGHCPLRRMLVDADRDTRTRALSGAVLVEVGETDVLPDLEPVLGDVDADEAAPLLAELRRVAPSFSRTLEPA
ncbi:tetratricopeptide repeat-containing glycosyltransferase family 2 protein [Kineococcus terrestris]|uniref:tetratricopeptide repeat-containing glycosyltransferase family 2 protein n=1 Tax=Kineococcus terrestris TaxID=2044856 RepID=UPI0034DB1997